MANKFSGLIFTEEGKDTMTKALADKGQMSIINAYTFTTTLTKDLTYSQISGLNPKQTKPMGTVTTDLTTNTVEARLVIDNRDVTADYNLKGIAITGVYGTDNYVLGIINTNETTLVPAYNGQSAQSINLDVSFAISDTSIVTVNTQYAGMLTVADYIALQKYIDQRDATKADDTATVHKTGNETINDIKTFLKTIVGSVSGNSGTSDRVNTLAINANVALLSLNNGVYLSTNASKTTSDKPTGAAETYVFVKESNVERFTDISNGQSYFRVKNGSTYTAWNRFSTAVELSEVDDSAVHKTGNETIGGKKTFTSAIIADLQGNADTATKLTTARTLKFTGAATGSGVFDGSGDMSIALTEASVTRTDTKSTQTLAPGSTFTMLDSVVSNTSGEITGVNVKTATMPSVFPPNNDTNLVHKSGAETVGGKKTFTDGLSGDLSGNATSATKLASVRKINGEGFDGTTDITVDPVVQTISTNKDVFALDNGFYYYANIAATNKPSGSSNYFVVEVIQSGNNGFMQLVDSNNNAWWTTKTGGAWSDWKAVANDALVAHLDTTETFTGKKTFSAGLVGELTGNSATTTKLKTARKIGGVSFDASTDINLPGVNTTGNQDTTGNAATATKWATARKLTLTGDVAGSVTMDGSGDVSIATSGTNLVHKTGNETVGGDKSFTGNLALSGTFNMNAGDGNVNVIRLGYVAGTDYSRNAMLNGDGNSWVGAGEGGSKMFTDFINNGAVSGTKLAQLASASESTVFVSDSGYAYLVVGAQNYQSGNYDGISVWQFGTSNLTNPAGNALAVDNTVVHKTGSEEVAGYKNFSGGMKTNNADIETYLDMIGEGETSSYSVRHKVVATGNSEYPSAIPNATIYPPTMGSYHRTWELPFVSDATNTVNIDSLIGNGSVVFSSKYVAGTLPTGFSGWGNLTFGHANSGSSNNRYQLLHDTHGYNTYVRYMDSGTWLAWQQLATVTDTGWLDLPLASGVTGTARYRIINNEVKIQIYNVSGITGTSITTGLISNLPFGVAKTGYFTGVIGNATVGVAITDQEQLYIYKTLNGSFSATDTARISFSWQID